MATGTSGAERVFVIGVGMTNFVRCETDVKVLAQAAARDALKDADLDYDTIEQAFCGYVNGMSTLGQQTLYGLGMTGIPVYNVNNNCSTGSTALYMAYTAIRTGQNDAVLALGFEKMQKGPLEKQLPGLEEIAADTEKEKKAPIAARMFGDAGRDHIEKYGTKPETFARIAVKNHLHSVHNPRSQYREACSIEEVLASRMIHDPLTLLQACPTSDGAAAAVVVSEAYLSAHPHPGAIEIAGMALTTDRADDFSRGRIGMVGMGMTERAARQVYEQTGIGPNDVQVIELHDCFSTNELITYEGLGLCAEGEGEKLVVDDACTYGGRWVVNPSGGLLSKGHPIGATGLAQCAELVWQLRGQAEKRQVEAVEAALQHNLGLGGACVVALYKRA
ncbi:MAG: lipid-transfer protein [Deltaproteobacteria bacterium]|nr:lipid-transfer protein [Deltaproteobacteria bacterium]MBW2382371.1 lipid-transfer protein [Deltaproteobacteria bacterium]MBW2698063.1 lipid-transfer protein [Deltaproteobacteria bacterium]